LFETVQNYAAKHKARPTRHVSKKKAWPEPWFS
jgi:hypothetical protein